MCLMRSSKTVLTLINKNQLNFLKIFLNRKFENLHFEASNKNLIQTRQKMTSNLTGGLKIWEKINSEHQVQVDNKIKIIIFNIKNLET